MSDHNVYNFEKNVRCVCPVNLNNQCIKVVREKISSKPILTIGTGKQHAILKIYHRRREWQLLRN